MRAVSRPRGDLKLELIRKSVHVGLGLIVVLLVNAGLLSWQLLGISVLFVAALVLYNANEERELLTRIISINRPDARIPGLDVLAYFTGMWLVFVLFPLDIASAAIMIVAIGDPAAHLVSRSFGGVRTMVTPTAVGYGIAGGIVAGGLAAWLPGYVPFISAFIAASCAMFVEAYELRIADHRVDDNFTIPLISAVVLTVLAYVPVL